MRKHSVILILVFLLICIATAQLTSDEIGDRVKKATEFSKDISDFFASNKDNFKDLSLTFAQKLVKVGVIAGPIFSVVSLILDIAFAFIPKPESEEMQFMKKEFENLNNRFDVVFIELDEIKKLIAWEALKSVYAPIENAISFMRYEMRFLRSGTTENQDFVRASFIQKYEMHYRDAALHIAFGILDRSKTFSENLLAGAMQHTDNHRPKVQAFATVLMHLIVVGIEFEATYLKLTNETQLVPTQAKWETLLKEVKQEIERVDRELANNWRVQLDKDVPDFTDRHHALDHNKFAWNLREMLEAKYTSLDFFVFSYREMHGWGDHAMQACHGIVQFRKKGRNLVLSWTEKSSPRYTIDEKLRQNQISSSISGMQVTQDRAPPVEILNRFGSNWCDTYKFLGVFGSNHDGSFAADIARFSYVKINVKFCIGPLGNLHWCWTHRWPEFFILKFN